MRIVILASAFVLLGFTQAAGTQANWPIETTVKYMAPIGAAHSAAVRIDVDDAANAIEVDVYGLDGMRVGADNIVRVHRAQLAAGESFTFNVALHPGPGRSFLIVSARAHFERGGSGQTVRSFPFGREDNAQQREHSHCVRQDADGVWIRDPDCSTVP